MDTRIEDIPTDRFNQVLEAMICDGWRKIREYGGFDAWIDYGQVVLKKGSSKVTFEWDNWFEGVIEGPASMVEDLKTNHGL